MAACPTFDISNNFISPSNVVSKETWLCQQFDQGPMLTTDSEFDQSIFSTHLENREAQDSFCNHMIEGTDLPYLVLAASDDDCQMLIDYNRPCDNSDNCVHSSLSWITQRSESLDGHFYDCGSITHGMMLDVPERYIMLPFVERSWEGNGIVDEDLSGEGTPHSIDNSFYRSDIMMNSSDENSSQSLPSEDFAFDPQWFVNSIPDVSELFSTWPNFLPREMQKIKNVTLVLDLDETLIHSSLEPCNDADFTFTVFLNSKDHTVYVRKRPHLHEFLQRVSHLFQIVIFTASQSIYAEKLLDILDPDQTIFSRRMYRESCVFSDGSYTKDLSILGVDLAKVIIVDNSPQVFRLQVNNGIPIKSWFDDPSDCALLNLLPFLETLVDVDDVRPVISKRFKKE
ncbi:uncharacterized protein LOC144709851 [Wolffia australiana]